MNGWTGLAYTSPTITATSATGSGWLDWMTIIGQPGISAAIDRAYLRYVPSNLATDETLDLVYEIGFSSAGAGGFDLHAFTQTTSSNAAQNVILPGGESTNILVVGTDLVRAPLSRYFRLTWDAAGTSKSMNFLLYAVVVLG